LLVMVFTHRQTNGLYIYDYYESYDIWKRWCDEVMNSRHAYVSPPRRCPILFWSRTVVQRCSTFPMIWMAKVSWWSMVLWKYRWSFKESKLGLFHQWKIVVHLCWFTHRLTIDYP
jgi:hypothetical protein